MYPDKTFHIQTKHIKLSSDDERVTHFVFEYSNEFELFKT